MHTEPRKGSKRDKSEEQTSEGPGHILWSKNISESSGSNSDTALFDPGIRDGERGQHRAK